jgi:predicted homoserine dehydrogenase-like protein
MELVCKLRQRAADHNPIRVGIIGCGQMGSGLAHTIGRIIGMTVNAIADILPERAIHTFIEMDYSREQIVVVENAVDAEDALLSGKVIVTPDAMLMPTLEGIEANVEVTGIPDTGARVACASIENQKPIIMMNVETDITVGAILNHMARKAGALYTVASGDEPGVCKMLYEQAVLMGFQVVCLGKGKNNPIDSDATPESCAQEAASKDMNPEILASFKDGTKTMVEMAAVSNATGLLPDIPGMYGPKVEVEELVNVFIPQKDGGIFSRPGMIDYSTGRIAPGVFAIVYSDEVRIRKDMKFITRADGPYYLHFRPYHLCDLETSQSIAEAVLLKEVTATAETMHSEVVCVAKRDLPAGHKVGRIGSADWLGKIYTYTQAKEKKAIPIGIAADGVVTKDVSKGELLTEDNFTPDSSKFIYELRQKQNHLIDTID